MVNIVTDFGADPTGVSISTTAIQNAINSGASEIYAPQGVYLTDAPLIMQTNCQTFYCNARGAATILNVANNGPTIQIANSPVYVEIHNLVFSKNVAANAGDNAIETFGSSGNFLRFDNLVINNHWNAFHLGYTGYSYIQNCYIQQNYSDGIAMQADVTPGAMQWTITNTLIELNDGYALVARGASSGNYNCPLGEWNNVSSFANRDGGIAVFGNAHTQFQAVRMMGGFFGQDGGSEILIDAYSGFNHKLVGVYCELSSTLPCGRSQGTISPALGYGIIITANNSDVTISGAVCRGNSLSGIYSAGTKVIIDGCHSVYNGAGNVSGNMNGVYIGGGRSIVTGGNYTNNKYGVVMATDNHIICDNNLANNTIAPYYTAAPLVTTKFANNLLT